MVVKQKYKKVSSKNFYDDRDNTINPTDYISVEQSNSIGNIATVQKNQDSIASTPTTKKQNFQNKTGGTVLQKTENSKPSGINKGLIIAAVVAVAGLIFLSKKRK